MSKVTRSTRVADRAINTLLGVSSGESVLVVTDESSSCENGEIIDAMLGLARENGAKATLIRMGDVTEDIQTLPVVVKKAMEETDVLIGITMSTAASVVHHEFPEALREQNRLRSIIMVKRSFDALTSPAVLTADYPEMAATAERIRKTVDIGSRIRLTSEQGTDLSADIDGMPVGRTDYAHESGEQTLINWGEVYTGPTVGTTVGTAVIDGPVLGYDWPTEPIEVQIKQGQVVDITGDRDIAPQLLADVRTNENAENIAEIAFGINPHADFRETNIWKKGRGRAHIAVGSGIFYGQNVDSPIHKDLIMNKPTVRIDGEEIIKQGKVTV